MPSYPVFILSKSRWESRLTAKSFEKNEVPYRIVVEPQEFDKYAEVIDKRKIIVTPFSNLGQGGIPARNFIWEVAASENSGKHWICDDNINGFCRLHNNFKIRIEDGAALRLMEIFTDRYDNVGISGPHYDYFAPRKTSQPPYYLNTRIYSCILLRNDLPYRWRGRYNEDTDLSLRALKDGWCTVLFTAFLQYKTPTMTMKGGNTDSIYNQGDNRKEFAESLKRQHPDVVEVTEKFGRWHHQVNYEPFKKNKLIKKPDLIVPKGINNYGLVLKTIGEKK